MLKIDSGEYKLADRNLVLDLEEGFDLSGWHGCHVLCGENGLGKTSFLEKILIPALDRKGVDFLYIGQDIRNQLYTLRALLAAMGLSVLKADERELLRVWVRNSPTARVLVLDEFDKYFADVGFIFQWTREFIRSSFVVTHQEPWMERIDAQATDRVCRVHFEQIGHDGCDHDISQCNR